MEEEEEKTESEYPEPDLPVPKVIDGKDEMNLAEFPLSAIADRLDPGLKTLSFEDQVWDNSRGEMVPRQLTITASDQYGLPTALDDEVILGLVQLSKMREFADRHVSFTRYQLIQLLGWRNESKTYERIEKSLNRWVGVTLYYKNAWWSKKDKCWVDEKFHILDNVTLYDKEKARKQSPPQPQLPLSSFTWNEVIFKSFRDGNLKGIDFDFFKSLESAVAKRLYRFLDKRFFHRSRWEFNLKEVSWEHIGISRNYDAANIKRKLLPGIRELEARGFLQPMEDTERFRKVRSGEWRVIFEKAQPKGEARPKAAADDSRLLIQALIQRGVTPSTAEQTVASFPAERIRRQLEVFDWLVSKKDPKVSRNPAGFLVSSIKSEYVAPRGFVSREEDERRQAQIAAKKRRAEERAKELADKEEAQHMAREGAIQTFWQALSAEERLRLEAEAIDQASSVQRELLGRGGSFATAARKSILDSFALRSLQEAA